ncbi:hypothetical protein PFX98_01305 [Paucibacter sediminis]|uniref:Uncharacterized protein n=1 Tax=Paucibacter sediminis TaxID=3019553 RepID=A0AA95NH83_9BURK|nr:hypothetical protein [Paucibacter sp. S2-9]WIT12269.1 hypothetical protein PFX98_01305 [Paucibacter sp. S2-9]
MTNKTSNIAWPQRAPTQQTESAAAVAANLANSVANTDVVTAPAATNHRTQYDDATAANLSVRLHAAPPRKRKAPSAEPLAKFRSKGISTWDKAQDYEWAATFAVGHFGLMSTRQLGEWVFRELATTGARHRQAQALTLRLCVQARAGSVAQRLATEGHRAVLRTLGRKRVGKCFYYYLNAAGLRYMQMNFGLSLPDASKSLTTASDMAKRKLVFEHCLSLYRANPDLTFVGPAALAADVYRKQHSDPLERALLSCLANLWCAVDANGRATYTYAADRPGSSNGVSVANYRELAKAASLLLGRDIGIDVIGRRMPNGDSLALTDTRLARDIVKATEKEVFRTPDGHYKVEKLVAFFVSLKPHAARLRALMEQRHA